MPTKAKNATMVETPATETIRLHIAPLTPESAKAIVPAKYLSATSFHTIDTFPEKNYGFVTVSRSEAEALRRKFHGTVFRGMKMSIEEARPAKRAMSGTEDEETHRRKKACSSKGTSRREEGVLRGFEIPDGRQVRRGWTKNPAQKLGKEKNAAPAGTSECLFKTILPPAVASQFSESKPSTKKDKGRAVKNQVVVKEFKHSTKFPSFLKMSSASTDASDRSAEFLDGVGWVNDAGQILESAPTKRRRICVEEPVAEDDESSEGDDEGENEDEGEEEDEEDDDDDDDEDDDDDDEDDDEDDDVSINHEMGDGPTLNPDPEVYSNEDASESGEDSDSSSEDESIYSRMSTSESGVEDISDSENARGSSSDSSVSDSSDSASTDDSESEPGPEEQEQEESTPDNVQSAEPAVPQQSSNFTNLTSIFKPTLSLNIESGGQFKFFGDDLDSADVDEEPRTDGAAPEVPDDSILYTPITPRVARYRSGAPTPDTAIAPRFRDFLPFARDASIERDYFPTVTAGRSSPDDVEKPHPGVKLLFPHTYDDTLHGLSIWGSVKLPNILTTGELAGKQSASEKAANDGVDDQDTEMAEAGQPAEDVPVPEKPASTIKTKITASSAAPGLPKTGAGSSIVGWAGKKKTFDDDDDLDMLDASANAPTKSKTGAGSGVTAWAGKKKTFDDDEDENVDEEAAVGGATTIDADPVVKKSTRGSKEQEPKKKAMSVIQVWEKVFYENRGDWNRQWKRKKREVAKARRKKEKAKRGWTAVAA
ncbi:hypothetical protein Dda_9140 [Drechslerella dactyloides]|uniref:Uncharacterized protein n=1 Tax=Drechslerella dactyloides TaxID=74499 RepID=A0AAD6IPS4_DREDA|nr:hypothetical protein Dda_9140 [Drechslerella dactyloides]